MGGALVSLLGATTAVLVDAVSYVCRRSRCRGYRWASRIQRPSEQSVLRRLGGGPGCSGCTATGSYGYWLWARTPWFACSAVGRVVMIAFGIRTLHLTSVEVGLALTLAGVGGLIGSGLALQLGAAVQDPGRAVVACHLVTGLSFAVMAAGGGWFGFAAGQLLLGLSMGAGNANEMGLRNSSSPRTSCRAGRTATSCARSTGP